MGIEALLSTQIIDTTAVGRAVMTAADAAAARTAIDAAATSHTHAASDITSGIVATARLATGTANSTTYLRGDQTWATVAAAGVGGSTGSVDNAVLRADGTSGSTVQSSSIVIADNATASPNNTVNHASIQATGGTTNVSVSIVPKGSGSFSLQVPDGTVNGGDARGTNAVDLQTVRASATDVASGASSFVAGINSRATNSASIAIGWQARSTGVRSVAIGNQVTASAVSAVAMGEQSQANGISTVALGYSSVASGTYSVSIGQACATSGQSSVAIGQGCAASATNSVAIGNSALANRQAMAAYAQGQFAATGDAQEAKWVLRNKTTDGTTAVTLFADGSSTRCSLTSGKVLHAIVLILGSKSDGSAVAAYLRQVAIKNVGGTTSLVGTVNTIGTDTAAGTSIAITADDTNDALQIAVTGVAGETWRWVATVTGPELAYGT